MPTVLATARTRAARAIHPYRNPPASTVREAIRSRVRFERDCWPATRDDLREMRRILREDPQRFVREGRRTALWLRWQAAERLFEVVDATGKSLDGLAALQSRAFWALTGAASQARRAWEDSLDPLRLQPCAHCTHLIQPRPDPDAPHGVVWSALANIACTGTRHEPSDPRWML